MTFHFNVLQRIRVWFGRPDYKQFSGLTMPFVVLYVFLLLPPTKKRFKFFNHYIKMICIFESSNNNNMTRAQQTLDFLSWTLPSKLTTLESTELAYEAINEAISKHGELKMFVNRKNQIMKKLMNFRIEKRKQAAQ